MIGGDGPVGLVAQEFDEDPVVEVLFHFLFHKGIADTDGLL